MIISAIEWATTRRLQAVGWRRKESRLARHTMFRAFTGLGASGQKEIMDM